MNFCLPNFLCENISLHNNTPGSCVGKIWQTFDTHLGLGGRQGAIQSSLPPAFSFLLVSLCWWILPQFSPPNCPCQSYAFYIRHTDFRPSPIRPSITLVLPPPLLLKKQGGLESSGQRLISSNGKTKGIVYILLSLVKKNIFIKCSDKKNGFSDC